MRKRILSILIAFDIFVFALVTLGGSRRNETISAAAWDMECDGKWQGKLFRPLIDLLMTPVERNHCRRAWVKENQSEPTT